MSYYASSLPCALDDVYNTLETVMLVIARHPKESDNVLAGLHMSNG